MKIELGVLKFLGSEASKFGSTTSKKLTPNLKRFDNILFSGVELRAGMVFCEAKRASNSQQQISTLGKFALAEKYIVKLITSIAVVFLNNQKGIWPTA